MVIMRETIYNYVKEYIIIDWMDTEQVADILHVSKSTILIKKMK
jgi:hypothetical protein